MNAPTPTEADRSPRLFKCYVTIRCWHNRSDFHDNPIIAPCFLTGTIRALAMCEDWRRNCTIPVLGEDYRLCNMDVFSVSWRDCSQQWEGGRQLLSESLKTLSSSWDDVLREGKVRLADKFVLDEYPAPSTFGSLWQADCKICVEDAQISTLSLLGEYSRYFREPWQPDTLDAIAWARHLEEERAKPAAQRKILSIREFVEMRKKAQSEVR